MPNPDPRSSLAPIPPAGPAAPRLRLFVAAELAAGAAVPLTAEQAHYLGHVMRRAPGETVALFNGRDGEWEARIEALGRRGGSARAEALLRPQRPEPDLWLLAAALKRDAFELVVEKATELGAAVIRPVLTERTVVPRLNLDRLGAIAREAAEQCRRLSLPALAPPLPLAALLGDWPAGRRLVLADESGGAPPLADALAALPRGGAYAVLIGPEGGFGPAELDRLRACPFVVPVGLGPRILRAETAAIALLACLQALRGDWRGD